MALLPALIATCGCQSPGVSPNTGRCVLEIGMDTDQLALCGCVSADTSSDYQVPMSSSSPRGTVTRVSVVNYMCPLGSRGVAKVVVVNGIASELYD